MSFICFDNGCVGINAPVGSDEWKKQMQASGVCQEDIETIAKAFLDIQQAKPKN